MAIYHLHMSAGSKSKDAPAAAHASYISATDKYAKKRGVVQVEHGNMPSWAAEQPMDYWAAADEFERKNGTTYKEIEVALPRELYRKDQTDLVRDFVAELFKDEHAWTFAVHDKGDGNPHAHIMFSERILDGIKRDKEQFFKRANSSAPEKGGALKSRAWKAEKGFAAPEKFLQARERWADLCNQALKRNLEFARVDHRSLEAQCIDREPQIHLGPNANAMEKKGIPTDRGDLLREIRRDNVDRESLKQALETLSKAERRAQVIQREKVSEAALRARREVAEAPTAEPEKIKSTPAQPAPEKPVVEPKTKVKRPTPVLPTRKIDSPHSACCAVWCLLALYFREKDLDGVLRVKCAPPAYKRWRNVILGNNMLDQNGKVDPGNEEFLREVARKYKEHHLYLVDKLRNQVTQTGFALRDDEIRGDLADVVHARDRMLKQVLSVAKAARSEIDKLAAMVWPSEYTRVEREAWKKPYLQLIEKRGEEPETVKWCLACARHDATPEGQEELKQFRNQLLKTFKGCDMEYKQKNKIVGQALDAIKVAPDRRKTFEDLSSALKTVADRERDKGLGY